MSTTPPAAAPPPQPTPIAGLDTTQTLGLILLGAIALLVVLRFATSRQSGVLPS